MDEFETRVAGLLTRLADQLLTRNWRMATAESCTGGWIAKCCTDMAGSSGWFDCGVIAYSNQAKEELLGVSHDDLLRHGAVSDEIACQMATGAKRRSRVEVAVAVTGIAGPTGGMPGKPVGLVHFGWCIEDRPASCQSQVFAGDRNAVRQQTVVYALEGILACLEAAS